MELVGNVYGRKGAGNYLAYTNITVALTSGGAPIDLSQMVVSYNDNNGGHNANLTYETVAACTHAIAGDAPQSWCIAQHIGGTSAMLGNNEQMIITVGLPQTATSNTKISINFQPAVGAILPVTRTIPGGLTQVQPLY